MLTAKETEQDWSYLSLWIRVQILFLAFHLSGFSPFDKVCRGCWSPVVSYETNAAELQGGRTPISRLRKAMSPPKVEEEKEKCFSPASSRLFLNPADYILEWQGLSLLLPEMSATINNPNKETARALLFVLPLLHSARSLFLLRPRWLQLENGPGKSCHMVLLLADSSMAVIIVGHALLLDDILIDVNKTSQVVLKGFFSVFFFSRKWGASWGCCVLTTIAVVAVREPSCPRKWLSLCESSAVRGELFAVTFILGLHAQACPIAVTQRWMKACRDQVL